MARRRRYPSGLTGEQWKLIEPLLPAVNRGGRPEKHPRRAIVDAILYVVRTGCSWRQLPADFPPWQTVYWYFVRVQQGRNPQPSAGIIGSQSVKGAGTVTRNSRGAKTTLLRMYLATPVRFVIADGGFAGELVDWASRILATTLHIVRKPEGRPASPSSLAAGPSNAPSPG